MPIPFSDVNDLVDVLNNLSDLLGKIEQWKESFDLTNPDAVSECSPSSSFVSTPTVDGLDTQIPAWETVLMYESNEIAMALNMCNAMQIMLLKMVRSVFALGQIESESFDGLPLNFSTVDSREYRLYQASIDICRSIQYTLEDENRATFSLSMLFAIRMAYDVLGESYPSIGSWLKHTLREIENGQYGRWVAAKYLLETKPVPSYSQE